ncbi:MAG: hypothetical protein PVJ40_10675 [Gammaproteobacteria bacterium]|jgi:hypothetical protein
MTRKDAIKSCLGLFVGMGFAWVMLVATGWGAAMPAPGWVSTLARISPRAGSVFFDVALVLLPCAALAVGYGFLLGRLLRTRSRLVGALAVLPCVWLVAAAPSGSLASFWPGLAPQVVLAFVLVPLVVHLSGREA